MATEVTAVIAAKQEGPSVGEVVTHLPLAEQVFVMVGSRPTGRSERAAGAATARTTAAARGRAIRRAILLIRRRSRCSSTRRLVDPEDIPLVEPILSGEADHVTASRLRADRASCMAGSTSSSARRPSFITAHQLAIRLPPERQSERLPCMDQRAAAARFTEDGRPSNRNDHHTPAAGRSLKFPATSTCARMAARISVFAAYGYSLVRYLFF